MAGQAIPHTSHLWLVALFVVPLGVLILVSFASTNILGLPVYGFYPGNYSEVFQGAVWVILARSLIYAALATIVSVSVGYSTAYNIARYGGKYRNSLILLVILPWLIDYLIRIYSWLQLLGQSGWSAAGSTRQGWWPARDQPDRQPLRRHRRADLRLPAADDPPDLRCR